MLLPGVSQPAQVRHCLLQGLSSLGSGGILLLRSEYWGQKTPQLAAVSVKSRLGMCRLCALLAGYVAKLSEKAK